MNRWLVPLAALVVAMLGPAWVLAQTAPGPAPPSNAQILAAAINVVGVMVMTRAVTWAVKWFGERAPYLIPIIAGAWSPLIGLAQSQVAQWTGQPIDLSPLLALWGGGAGAIAMQAVTCGGAAVWLHQIYQQKGRVNRTAGVGRTAWVALTKL
jgi:hypothetical protein